MASAQSIAKFGRLSTAEATLIDQAASGALISFGLERPDTVPPVIIRAEIVRFLLLGGDTEHPVHEKSISITGAWIDGDLDCVGCKIERGLRLQNCYLNGGVMLDDAETRRINLDGSSIKSFSAEDAHVKGELSLAESFQCRGAVRFCSCAIDGNVNFESGIFEGWPESEIRYPQEKWRRLDPANEAIIFDGAKIGGGFSLFKAKCAGPVRFNVASIGGDVDLTDCSIHGRPLPDIDPDAGKVALCFHRASIGGRLFLYRTSKISGQIRMLYAHTTILADDETIVPAHKQSVAEERIVVEGFSYDRLYMGSPVDARSRINWLAQQPRNALNDGFLPQPWNQLSKVLKEQGHLEAAKEIAIEHQTRWRAAGRINSFLARSFHCAYGCFTSYGFRPQQIVPYTLVVWLGCAIFYAIAAGQGGFAPADAIKSTKFNPYIYSLDVVLPLVSLGQAKEWRPNLTFDKSDPVHNERNVFKAIVLPFIEPWSWAHVVRVIVWLETLFGWIAGIATAAYLNSLAKRDA